MTTHANATFDESTNLMNGVGGETVSSRDEQAVRRRRMVSLLVDQCVNNRSLCRKKRLSLINLQLKVSDLPVEGICQSSLAKKLRILDLNGNGSLLVVPDPFVHQLVALQELHLSQCGLSVLPERWDLPQLKKLNLSHNRLTEFPGEGTVAGLPRLRELNLYGNKIVEITLHDDELKMDELRELNAMNNFIEIVPMQVCHMKRLVMIDVSSNPLVQPPLETCERGLCSMKRYYRCLMREAQNSNDGHSTLRSTNNNWVTTGDADTVASAESDGEGGNE